MFEDSVIQCFEKRDDKKPLFSVHLKSVAQYLTVGPFTRSVPGRPTLPSAGDENLLISFPKDTSRKEKEIIWLICRDLTQLK